jgi:hypothetical protein
MATVDKNFRIKNGLVVEGSTATVNGQNVLTETGSDQYILDLIGGETLVKSVSNEFDVSVGGELSIDRATVDAYYDPAGSAATAQGNAEDYADGLAVNYDPAGSAATAQGNAEDYADGLAVNYDPAGSAGTAETNANTYTDTALEDYTPTASLDTTIDGYGYLKSADLSGYATETFVGTAIDNLVDGAPGLLDTLNEIAAAINDDANYATTMTTALAGKQDELTASTGITIDGSNNISVTANTYDAYGAAATAQSNAEDYADGLASNYDASGTAAGLVDDLKDATTAFTAINVNSVAKQIAATTGNIVTAAATTAYSWAKASYRSAEFLVKSKTATHTEVTKIMLTLDSSDNVYLTEYGMSSTSGTSLQAITADISGTDVRIRVTPANANTEILITGTLLV